MILCHCKHCGLIFKSRAFDFGSSSGARIVLRGNKEGCPACGKLADMVDGEFVLLQGIANLIEGPAATTEMYQRFAQILEEKSNGNLSADQFEQEAASISPDFHRAAKTINERSVPWVIVMLLLVWLKGCTTEVKIDLNELIDQGISIGRSIEDPGEKANRHEETTGTKSAGQSTGAKSKTERKQADTVTNITYRRLNHLRRSTATYFFI